MRTGADSNRLLMRINKMITKRKIFDLLPNSLNQFFKEMYGDQFGEFVCVYWDFKGKKRNVTDFTLVKAIS